MQRRFIQCDVFTSMATRGNGLAVVLDSDGLDTAQMQTFAAWTNLAETTFILPPDNSDADYRVRIFTPLREMPFAGHPTLGSCAAWLHAGGEPRNPDLIRQECRIGLVDIDMTGNVPAFVAPQTKITEMPGDHYDRLIEALELDRENIKNAIVLDNGPVWYVLEFADADAVLNVDSALVRWPSFGPIGLIGKSGGSGEHDYEVRMLAPSSGMTEDPVTGSLNAAIARWFSASGRLGEAITVAQGTLIGREGRIHIWRDSADSERILIGGETQIVIEGSLSL
jgi:PhzF family phenazine biosynthesis protein